MKPFMFLIAASFAAAACASAPAYQAATSANAPGYSEQVIEKDRYRVQYRLTRGDSVTARDYVLLRAAELTLEKGYSTFEIVSQSSDARIQETPEAGFGLERDYAIIRDCGLLTCRTAAAPVYTRGDFGAARQRTETIVSLDILLSNKEASISPSVYDASQVVSNLR